MRKSVAAGTMAILIVACAGVAARADDVTDQLNEAMKAYAKKDYSTATAALESAEGLIHQMSAEIWKKVLPDPIGGWTADDAETTTLGAAVLGGGTTAKRTYHRDAETVDVSLMVDSPMLQGLAPLLMGGIVTSSDMKLLIVDGRKIVYTKSENSYQTLVANRALVKVQGSNGVDEPTLRAYLDAVKFQDIEQAAQ